MNKKKFNPVFPLLLIFFFTVINLYEASPQEYPVVSMFNKNRSRMYIPDIDNAYGVAFTDINKDNRPDIYVVRTGQANQLLLNINLGRYIFFKDVAMNAGLSGILERSGYIVSYDKKVSNAKFGTLLFDYDNDGDKDVLITGWGVTTALYLNKGELEFENVTDRLNLFPPIDLNGCCSADINNDGWLDIFLTDQNYSNRMLLNLGNGEFSDITESSGLQYIGCCQGASFCDVDCDGDADLYVTSWAGPDLFYQNRGNGYFKLMYIPLEVCQQSLRTNGVTFADIDNDGDFDLFITNHDGLNYLYRNETLAGDTNWVFSNNTIQANLIDKAVSHGSAIADFNNDGWQDIFVTNAAANQFYMNQRDGTFIKVFEDPLSYKDSNCSFSTGAAYADFDLDGDIDLFVANRDSISNFYENVTNNLSFIKFNIQGVISNRDGLGTRVELYKAGFLADKNKIIAVREISGGGGYLSLNDFVIHIGLDTVKQVDVKIVFPSGKIITRTGLRAGNSYDIFETNNVQRYAVFSYQHFLRLSRESIFWIQVFLVVCFFILVIFLIRLGLKRYRWSLKTALMYTAGLFLMAAIVIFALGDIGLFYNIIIINILTITFVLLSIYNMERLYRLRNIREKYRSVLINLSNQIINIHDNDELLTLVVENIQINTEFQKCCAAVYSNENKKFEQTKSKGFVLSLHDLNKQKKLSEIIKNCQSRIYWQKSAGSFHNFFDLLNANFIIAIHRGDHFFGFLSLGTDGPIAPLKGEDVDLYISIANQMAIAIENNQYIRSSNEMIKKLTEVEVREKYLRELEITNKELDLKNHQLQKLYDELKNTQTQLIHSEKMASLGQLVAGIAHELNNPIGFIYSNSKQLQTYISKIENFLLNIKTKSRSLKNKKDSNGPINIKTMERIFPDLKGLIHDTIRGSQMIKELVENLRKFSHLDQAERKIADIHEGIASCLLILKPRLKNRINIHKDYKAKGLLECNPGQLNQVFLNLLANAAQAIKEKGNIWINSYDQADNCIIEIKDDGVGIAENIMDKIFDPFFTTKDVGEGTGLGLSISYSIIKNHGGSIEVNSKLGEGTVFTVCLPYSPFSRGSE
jgi:signal transduction histidine kinase